MEVKTEKFVHIEFFAADDCPYCPTVRKMLKGLIESEVGMHIIIEEININSIAGRERIKNYQKLKGVPTIAINGIMKFMGVPHPTLLFNEVKRLVRADKNPKLLKPRQTRPSRLEKEEKDDFPFYT